MLPNHFSTVRNQKEPSLCAGWQHHPVCTRKFHFIIPVCASPEAAAAHGNIPALVEIWMQGGCKKPLNLPQYLADDAASPYTAPVSIFDSTSHLLHGVLHANGFGHLLRINGLEGGSQGATGEALAHMHQRLVDSTHASFRRHGEQPHAPGLVGRLCFLMSAVSMLLSPFLLTGLSACVLATK